jgi:hypothetical protein
MSLQNTKNFGLTCLAAALLGSSAFCADFSAGLLAGYQGGGSFRLSVAASDFARGFPLAAELGVSYAWRDPGDPLAARRIFINDNTNGTPEESGWVWNVRLDFLYRVKVLGLQSAFAYAGPRYSIFTGDFKYVGGNEDFEVTSNQWGLGAGAKASFPMSRIVSLTVSAGLDYFFAGTLYGHDTSYSPGGETVNGKHEYTFSDADAAINQPKWQPSLLLGITVGL